MTYTTKKAAIRKLNEYSQYGLVYQVEKTNKWGWATLGSGIDNDLRTGSKHIGRGYAKTNVKNVEYLH